MRGRDHLSSVTLGEQHLIVPISKQLFAFFIYIYWNVIAVAKCTAKKVQELLERWCQFKLLKSNLFDGLYKIIGPTPYRLLDSHLLSYIKCVWMEREDSLDREF